MRCLKKEEKNKLGIGNFGRRLGNEESNLETTAFSTRWWLKLGGSSNWRYALIPVFHSDRGSIFRDRLA
jgi:hypothetical protein